MISVTDLGFGGRGVLHRGQAVLRVQRVAVGDPNGLSSDNVLQWAQGR